MLETMQKQLERNIRLYGLLKIFTKRVFLPLTTVYFVEVGGLRLQDIGLLASISALVSLVAEIPTGYFADRITRRASLLAAALLAGTATLFFAFFPSLPGAIVGSILEALGYAFLSGASEALMHDTLVHLKRIDDYPKIVGRAQSFGLIGNTVLVALVPLTYHFNKQMPFFLGTVAYCVLGLIAYKLFEPPRQTARQVNYNPLKDLLRNLRLFVTRHTLLIFLSIGLLSGLYNSVSDLGTLVLKDLGLNPSYFGFVFAGASVVGIIGGFFIHHFRAVSLRAYTLFDTLIFTTYITLIGITHSLWFTIIGFAFYMGFWRLRNILYQHHLLKLFVNNEYKATLVSTLSFFSRGNEVWLPPLFAGVAASLGYYRSFSLIGLASFAALVPMFLFATRRVESLANNQ